MKNNLNEKCWASTKIFSKVKVATDIVENPLRMNFRSNFVVVLTPPWRIEFEDPAKHFSEWKQQLEVIGQKSRRWRPKKINRLTPPKFGKKEEASDFGDFRINSSTTIEKIIQQHQSLPKAPRRFWRGFSKLESESNKPENVLNRRFENAENINCKDKSIPLVNR